MRFIDPITVAAVLCRLLGIQLLVTSAPFPATQRRTGHSTRWLRFQGAGFHWNPYGPRRWC